MPEVSLPHVSAAWHSTPRVAQPNAGTLDSPSALSAAQSCELAVVLSRWYYRDTCAPAHGCNRLGTPRFSHPYHPRSLGHDGDRLDFDQRILGQRLDGKCRARRERLLKVFCVDLVDDGKVVHRRQQHHGLDNVIHPTPGRLEHGGHILEHHVGLRLDISAGEIIRLEQTGRRGRRSDTSMMSGTRMTQATDYTTSALNTHTQKRHSAEIWVKSCSLRPPHTPWDRGRGSPTQTRGHWP